MTGKIMGCCTNCFGDSFLARQIENLSNTTGKCDYCSASDVPLIEPICLCDYFELLSGVYREDTAGKTLVEWFKSDWSLFEYLDTAHCKELLSDILDDGQIVRKSYVPIIEDDGGSLERWEEFKEELKLKNRFFPKNVPDLDRLGKLLQNHLCADIDSVPGVLYRARIMDRDVPYSADEMGKPPLGKSTNGRANPAGIPYLYLASDLGTAIAEIRPHTSERVCVAKFITESKLRVADLRNPRKTISPFSLSDEEIIAHLRNEIGFLCQLGDELKRPVLPRTAHLEYLPSQYLCEFIKHLGFDGVMYCSSVGTGINFAMFDEAHMHADEVRTYNITCVNVNFAPFEISECYL